MNTRWITLAPRSWTAAAALGVVLIVAGCTPAAPNTEPAVNAFATTESNLVAGGSLSFTWTVSDPDGDALTCSLDVDGNGSSDYTIDDCGVTTSQSHTYAARGTFTPVLRVSDGREGQAEASSNPVLVQAATLVTTFTTCGTSGPTGPDQAACDTAYAGTNLEGTIAVAAGIQSFTIPASGTYRIVVEGAQGASAEPAFDGGRGARAQADLALMAGDTLQVLVGQLGSGVASNNNGGGGGGSFVVSGDDDPLVVAGGGGGMRVSGGQNGCDANTGTFGIVGSGGNSTSACTPKDADEGLGGSITSAIDYGAGGGGFYGDGEKDGSFGFGGSSWANGMVGGGPDSACNDPAEGGFGGGGSGSGCNGGGGGGGYSGGDGGWVAGGGGSFVTAAATNVTITVGDGIGEGDGTVTIEYLGN